MIPEKMQASFLDAVETIRLAEIDVPRPGAGQVLVELRAVGVCGSDVHYYDHGGIGEYMPDGPMILGHEASGVIVGLGLGVPESRRGERVSIEPQRPCRRCSQCKAGRYNLCPDIAFLATPPYDGAFTQYLVVETDFAHTVPDTMSFEAAALCEPLSVAIWALRKAVVGPGSRVLIAGAGPIGLICAQTARAFGASEVFVSDPVSERREIALQVGATTVIDPIVEEVSAAACDVDAFIDASGSAAAVYAGVEAVARAGRVVLVGSGLVRGELPLSRIQIRELTVTGVFRYANTWPLAIDLASSGRVDLDSLVTGRFSLSETELAMRAGKSPTAVKAVVYPQSGNQR